MAAALDRLEPARIRTQADFLKQGRRLAVRGLPEQGAVDVVVASLAPANLSQPI